MDVWLDDELRQAALIKFLENQEAARRAGEQFCVDDEIEQRAAFSALTPN